MEDSPVETPDLETSELDFEYVTVPVGHMPPETTPPPIVEKPERKNKTQQPKSGPPTLEEWQDFIGRFVLRGITEAYLNVAISDFYDDLSPRELESIRLTKDDLKEMSAPLATMAHKSTFLRKRGRTIIGSADSGEAVVALLIWMRRVNRLSKKYRKARNPKPQTVPGYVMEQGNGTNGSDVGQGPEFGGPSFGVWNPGTG